jgi:hypothetical protein
MMFAIAKEQKIGLNNSGRISWLMAAGTSPASDFLIFVEYMQTYLLSLYLSKKKLGDYCTTPKPPTLMRVLINRLVNSNNMMGSLAAVRHANIGHAQIPQD